MVTGTESSPGMVSGFGGEWPESRATPVKTAFWPPGTLVVMYGMILLYYTIIQLVSRPFSCPYPIFS